jgi:adenylyltransferase/sulfurtransferase
VILYLAGAGVRRLTIIDYDRVDIANLHRQVIHSESTGNFNPPPRPSKFMTSTSSVGHSKAESAREAALRLNSTLECVAYSEPITSRNALALVSSHDVVGSSPSTLLRFIR